MGGAELNGTNGARRFDTWDEPPSVVGIRQTRHCGRDIFSSLPPLGSIFEAVLTCGGRRLADDEVNQCQYRVCLEGKMRRLLLAGVVIALFASGCDVDQKALERQDVDPVFSPKPGTYSGSQRVYIRSPEPGMQIRYSLDGSVSGDASQVLPSMGGFLVSETLTVTAIACRSDFGCTDPVRATYFVDGTSAPVLSRAPGSFHQGQKVLVSPRTPGSVVHCTIDGTEPSERSPSCQDSVVIPTSATLKAVAVHPVKGTSSVLTVTISVNAPGQPIVSPVGGNYQGSSIAVNMTGYGCSSSGTYSCRSTLRYTLDGSDPTSTSPMLGSAGTIWITSPTTLKVADFSSSYSQRGPVATHVYRFTATPPTISAPSGTSKVPVNVTISSPQSAAVLRYTLDGSDPTANSPAYSAPLRIEATKTVKVAAFLPGSDPSAVVSRLVRVNPNGQVAVPVIEWAFPVIYWADVPVICSTAAASILFSKSARGPFRTYSGPIEVKAADSLFAYAVKDGMDTSETVSRSFASTRPASVSLTMGSQSSTSPSNLSLQYAQTQTVPSSTAASLSSRIDVVFLTGLLNVPGFYSPAEAKLRALGSVSTWPVANSTIIVDAGTSSLPDSAALRSALSGVAKQSATAVAGRWYAIKTVNGQVASIYLRTLSGSGTNMTATLEVYK